ncbi:hypothetical protein WR25_16714 [Diploscapter pachys]|uniref:Prokaryotic-type class I peptide chain release factors domain-containing protein n=1 Tax=Diploscapter pachys TaxID=2018661 RepID=A0A2A2LU89_9BILA|nr:hypothetical protein WR25_16714 [Diploscapter pachys]
MLFYRYNLITVSLRYASVKQKLKGYKFPEIRKEDCEQKFISGWGPGGQKVNKAENAVQLRHIPTGIVLKVHESRLQIKNIEIAYERMKFAVDRHLNGDDCYEEQYRRMQKEKEAKANEQRRKHREEKMKLKEGNSEDEDKENDKAS